MTLEASTPLETAFSSKKPIHQVQFLHEILHLRKSKAANTKNLSVLRILVLAAFSSSDKIQSCQKPTQ
ncbi:hypothetical protein [Desulfosporosinus lacus]|uniref:hypothetical protein n=1 Tax=Desulfosporosinus lacus TaxID=329936 RepID=UPI000934AFDF|nr:hypothetical protein [Desulfosporosinus lacus]